MGSFTEIKTAIDGFGETLEVFKQASEKKLEEVKAGQAQLQERIEVIEAKASSPGKTSLPGDKKDLGECLETKSGERFPILRKGSDFKSAFKSETEEKVSLADFLRGVAGMQCSPIAKKALSEGTTTAGGYAVPVAVMPQILEALVPASSLMQAGAGIVNVEGAKQFDQVALNAIPTAAWRSESGAVAESEPTFRMIPGVPRSLSFYFKASREVLADAVNFESALQTAIAQAFAKEMDRAGLRGSGVAPQPTGILNTVNVNAVTNGANGASLATTMYGNFISALQLILEDDAPAPTAAIMAPRSYAVLGGLKATDNQPLLRPDVLSNMQFLSTSQIPVNLTVGTSVNASEIYIGDFGKLMYVMRERPSIMMAKELFALTGEVGFVCHARVDVAVWYPQALAVVTGVLP